MEKRIVECVPNFSEGRDKAVIRQITSAIESSGGVKLLDVDPGEATNRTVVTFVGSPEAVIEAAFAGVKRAAELIDMRRHKGAHPRMGATDVLPLIPICGITLAECAELARKLAERIAAELHVPTYCYEAAAFTPERRNLAVCRAGEYEALPEKLAHKEAAPDFGARPFDDGVARTGATTVGARDFLIAVNFNLNTTSTRRANAIAFDVREKGRPVREGNPVTGKVVKDAAGNPVMQPGTLPATKAIGWFIEEYGIAQVSMNITDIATTPLHVAFDEVCRKADARGVRVTGTEIVGLVPKRALIEAGKYFLRKQRRSTGIAEQEIVRIAVRSMGLDDLKPFDPAEKVIEYLLEAEDKQKRLIDMTCKGFAEETASESPAPGGGSVAAYMGALGAALGTMVANLSSHKAGVGRPLGGVFRLGRPGTGVARGVAAPRGRGYGGVQPHHGRLRHAQVDGRGEGRPQRGPAGGDALCDAGAPADDEDGLRGFRNRACHGSRRQPQLGVRRGRRGAGRPQRRAGRRPQCPDQCRRAERPCRGRCARGRSRPPCGRGRTGRARGVGDSSK